MSGDAVAQDYHFLCLLWSVIFPRGSVGPIVTKFYRRLLLFGLILNWCTRIITTLIFFANFISRIAIYLCTYNMITICVVTNCHLCLYLQCYYHLRCYQLPFIFVLTILLPFALLPLVFLPVFKSSLLFSIDSLISLIDLNESSTSRLRNR